ncbi:MAG: hypothetical protein L0Z50_08825 [Verrucomicrobiales bacterium]|nr:hypothetical protein [Verrucomicrobiales bacterium]
MKAHSSFDEGGFRSCEASILFEAILPEDLRSVVSEQTLVRLALEAVQMVECHDVPQSEHSMSVRAIPHPLLTTVLIYSYAAGVLGSRDIEVFAQHDASLRYLCRASILDWDTLRLFRRQHVQLVTRCLEVLLETAWNGARSSRPMFAEFNLGCGETSPNCGRTTGFKPDFASEAERRVTRAIRADSMAMDE